jgi:hypothetical protein
MLRCPNGHELEAFDVPNSSWVCDICHNSVPKGDTTARCSYCNFDMCESCYITQLEGTSCHVLRELSCSYKFG